MTPKILLKKIRHLTTPVGIYQHGSLNTPDPKFGYALEDQARALIVAHEFGERKLEKIYLNFVIAAQAKDVFFNQFFYEESGFVEDNTPATVLDREEAYGITLWSLYKTGHYKNPKLNETVKKLTSHSKNWSSPRGMAAALIGLTSLAELFPEEEIIVEKLKNFYYKTAKGNWKWFENYLTYGNAILPWSLWERFLARNDIESKKIAEETTDFLIKTCQINGVPAPIGNKGWFYKNGEKSLFDQQPIDAAYMTCCLEKSYLATQKDFYLRWAEKWWGWFWGNNVKRISLIDKDFACFDGLTENGVNLNQGAESNICFLMAALSALKLKIWQL